MSKIIKANLLDFFESYEGDISIGHCVNCQGVMGAGVAKEIKKRYPQVFEVYSLGCKTKPRKGLGYATKCHIPSTRVKTVFNLHGQEYYGRYGKYLIEEELHKALTAMEYNSVGAVAFPYMMGCGLAGGDWDVVASTIEEVFEGREIIYCKL